MMRNNEIPQRSWQVLLLGGPSGVGKTSVSYRLASHFGIGITEVDDFQVILERMTTPTEQPVLHYWRTHPEAGNLSAEEIVKQTIAVGQVMASALEAVITNHIESRTPLVLDGDFILPRELFPLHFLKACLQAWCELSFCTKKVKSNSVVIFYSVNPNKVPKKNVRG